MTPLVTVLVSHYERPAGLLRACASVRAQQGIDRRDLELIVVDDASSSPAALGAIDVAAREYGALVVVGERYTPEQKAAEVLTLGRWLNRAQRHARGLYLSWLVDDAAYAPERCATLAAELEASPELVAAGCNLRLRCADAGGATWEEPREDLSALGTLTAEEVRALLAERNRFDHSQVVLRREAAPHWPEDPAYWRTPDWLAWRDAAARSEGAWRFLPFVGVELSNGPGDHGSVLEAGGTILEALRGKVPAL